MTSTKLSAGQTFPHITVPKLGGGELDLSLPTNGCEWQLIIIYRGKHCPLCTKYLSQLESLYSDFLEAKISIAVVSADPLEKAKAHTNSITPSFTIGYDLSIEQMESLGLYISHPRSAAETDRPFSEPGLFVINEDGKIQIVDISNAPFARPSLDSLIKGLQFIRNPENNYPIRGTYKSNAG